MTNFNSPGVYIEEVNQHPRAIEAVRTAVPVFIGYTEKAIHIENGDLHLVPQRIESLAEYRRYYGSSLPEKEVSVGIDDTLSPPEITVALGHISPFQMSDGIAIYFDNGGGPCYVVSVGNYDAGTVLLASLDQGLKKAGQIDEITLIVFPDGQGLSSAVDYYALQMASLHQCAALKDRFALLDVWAHDDGITNDISVFRNAVNASAEVLKYGAAYYPRLLMLRTYTYDPDEVNVSLNGADLKMSSLEPALHTSVVDALTTRLHMTIQPSSAIAGIYAMVDSTRGVWKAPANVNIDGVIAPVIHISDAEQDALNVDPIGGKSINAIRQFPGRGNAVVWGARTLAGNDNEWRYVSVIRFVTMVEESIKKGTEHVVFEPNDANTWVKVKAAIDNFLIQQWRGGALAGAKPDSAYFVKVGLGETMTALDVTEGRLIIEIGLAVVRPAEFIILRFGHKMQSG